MLGEPFLLDKAGDVDNPSADILRLWVSRNASRYVVTFEIRELTERSMQSCGMSGYWQLFQRHEVVFGHSWRVHYSPERAAYTSNLYWKNASNDESNAPLGEIMISEGRPGYLALAAPASLVPTPTDDPAHVGEILCEKEDLIFDSAYTPALPPPLLVVGLVGAALLVRLCQKPK